MHSMSLIFLVPISINKLAQVAVFVRIIIISTTLHALKKTEQPIFLDCMTNTIILTKLNIPQIKTTRLDVVVANANYLAILRLRG